MKADDYFQIFSITYEAWTCSYGYGQTYIVDGNHDAACARLKLSDGYRGSSHPVKTTKMAFCIPVLRLARCIIRMSIETWKKTKKQKKKEDHPSTITTHHSYFNYMTTQSLSSAFAPWIPISANVCGRFVGFRVLPCGLGVVADAALALLSEAGAGTVAVVGTEEGNEVDGSGAAISSRLSLIRPNLPGLCGLPPDAARRPGLGGRPPTGGGGVLRPDGLSVR
jgi:hypothetical protein